MKPPPSQWEKRIENVLHQIVQQVRIRLIESDPELERRVALTHSSWSNDHGVVMAHLSIRSNTEPGVQQFDLCLNGNIEHNVLLVSTEISTPEGEVLWVGQRTDVSLEHFDATVASVERFGKENEESLEAAVLHLL